VDRNIRLAYQEVAKNNIKFKKLECFSFKTDPNWISFRLPSYHVTNDYAESYAENC
jgi:hypothetical protein